MVRVSRIRDDNAEVNAEEQRRVYIPNMIVRDPRPVRRAVRMPGWRVTVLLLLYLATVSCSERTRPRSIGWWKPSEPDELPQMLNVDLPFRYPVALYLRRVQGNVMLRLHVDQTGRVVPESTRVVESSGQSSLDSAALAGVARLRFRPAHRRGAAVAVSLLFPVHFRHPEGPRLPGDSL